MIKQMAAAMHTKLKKKKREREKKDARVLPKKHARLACGIPWLSLSRQLRR